MDMPSRERNALYPPIEPFAQGRLRVSGGHEIYFEQCGNPAGLPVLMVHGGPGGGSSPTMRRYHNPQRYHIILFDQRGCGRSTPHAALDHNTTSDLIDDMERLRERLRVKRWQLFGGSWGSTLSLAYAQQFPERVSSLVLRGIFLGRRSEIDWFYRSGANALFPEPYANFIAPLSADERMDVIASYYARLTHPEHAIQVEAARTWSRWEAATLSLMQDADRVNRFGGDRYALAFARIESHYFVNGCFLDAEDQLLENAYRIRHIPGCIVHGRYDVVTPVRSAFDLKREWPEVDLRIVPDAGHAMTEPGIIHELIAATRRLS